MKDWKFRKDFVWGAATAAFQIEGDIAGRGRNIWDDFCDVAGNVSRAHNGKIACDHVNRYIQDVAMMSELGLDAYRFSISWPRVMPTGRGAVNTAGLDFYDRLTDELLDKGITPYATLYHWDLPSELNTIGGWQNPDIAQYFYKYAEVVGRKLGDRIKHFMTLNEPQCFVGIGYMKGKHAPGYRLSDGEVLKVIHNTLRAHGMGVSALRQTVVDAQIGLAMVSNPHYPATDTSEDIDATRKAILSLDANYDNWVYNVVHWCDPIYFGKYPDVSYQRFGELVPNMSAEDKELISQPLDFHGENVYGGCAVMSDGKGGFRMADAPLGYPANSLGWAVTPESLNFHIKTLYERYHKPIYITENGMCNHDWVCEDWNIHDGMRVDFMNRYLGQLSKAAESGADIRGYFAWSLMDNFEWTYGYDERFGIVYVDYDTQQRILKDSAKNYSNIIKSFKAR